MAIQEFLTPRSLTEAHQAFTATESSWLAGGTDLLVGVRLGSRDPRRVIDLKQIPELTTLDATGDHWTVGAAVSAYDSTLCTQLNFRKQIFVNF